MLHGLRQQELPALQRQGNLEDEDPSSPQDDDFFALMIKTSLSFPIVKLLA